MKLFTLLTLCCLFTQISMAQTNNYSIICPENTFLGAFSCEDIDNVPKQVSTIEEAMEAPYNIQIEGDFPSTLRVETNDDDVIFFCKNDPRLVKRELIFYIDQLNGPWYGGDAVAICSFTIETIPDLTPIDFIAPANEEIDCTDFPPTEVTFTGDDCFPFDQSQAYFTDQVRVEGGNTFNVRTWRTADACGNLSEPQEQIFTLNCGRPNIDVTVTCPDDTFLGAFSCLNIENVPQQPGSIEDAMTAPYNIEIEGEISSDIRVTSNDNATTFYCEADSRLVNRNIIIYKDVNFNFAYDIGEEIGGCSYTIETIPDLTPPEITIPSDIELACNIEPTINNTGDITSYEDNCQIGIFIPTSYDDEVIVEGNLTTILRSWFVSDPCGNVSEPKIQTITINCESTVKTTPEIGIFNCGN